MALTIEELLVNLGVDVSAFRANLAIAEKSLEGVVDAGDRVKAALAGVEGVGESLADALVKVGEEGDRVRAEFQAGLTEGMTAELAELQKAAGSVGIAMQRVGSNLGGAETALRAAKAASAQADAEFKKLYVSGSNLAKTLFQIGLSGGVSTGSILAAGAALKSFAVGIGATTAASSLAVASTAAAANAAIATAATASATAAALATGISAIAPPVAIAIAAFAAFEGALSKFQGDLDKTNEKIKKSNKQAGDSFKELNKTADDIHFDAATAELSELDKAILKAQQAVSAEGAKVAGSGGIFALGEEAARRAKVAADLTTVANKKLFDSAKAESNAAAKALAASSKQGVDDALSELGRLERSNAGIVGQIVTEYGRLSDAALPLADGLVKVKPSDDTLQAMRDLGTSINFTGPLDQMRTLQTALEQNAVKVREIGEAQHLSTELIDSETAKQAALIKQRFAEDFKINIKLGDIASLDGIKKQVDESKVAVGLFGREFDRTLPIIDGVKSKLVELKAAGRGSTEEAQKLQQTLSSLQGSQKITIKAETREAESAVDELMRAIRSGAPPVEIQLKKDKADQEIAELKASIKDLGKNDPIRLTAEKKIAELQIKETQALAQQKQTMPVDADTSAAQQKIAELNAAAQDAVAGKSKRLGEFDASDLNSALDQARSAISGGDPSDILQIREGLRNFLRENLGSPFGAGPQNLQLVQSAITSLNRALSQLNVQALGSGTSSFASPFDAALNELAAKQDGQIDKQDETNRLLREQNDLSRSNLDATRDVGSSLALGNIRSALIEKTRAATGVRGATF